VRRSGTGVRRWIGRREAVVEQEGATLVADDEAERTDLRSAAEELEFHAARAPKGSDLTVGGRGAARANLLR